MTSYESLLYEKNDGVVVITLNRPSAANGLNSLMVKELAMAAYQCDKDPSVKAVILTGSGRFFSVGGDLKEIVTYGNHTGLKIKQLADDLHRAISTFSRMNTPVIIAVNGIAAGAGFSLAITGDIVIASESAKFTMAYSANGLSPDGGASYYLPRLIGLRKAQELIFTNRTLDATEAKDWGLITKIVPEESILQEAQILANLFLKGSSSASAYIKKLLLPTFNNSLETQLELEARYISECADSSNGREGIKAFTEKRQPNFDFRPDEEHCDQ
jgi:2-(1,2-epoxy-1,2-dihydrophenyl)acetyl-CoA isomerase